jgi:hypothetical protein
LAQRRASATIEIGVSEDSYHSYFLLLPPIDEINAESEGGSVDKCVKNSSSELSRFSKPLRILIHCLQLLILVRFHVFPLLLFRQSSSSRRLLLLLLPPPITAPTAAAVSSVVQPHKLLWWPMLNLCFRSVSATQWSKRRRMPKMKRRSWSCVRSSVLAMPTISSAKRMPSWLASVKTRSVRRSPSKAERERIVAELERLEQERQERAAHCPFPKRPAGAVGFVREPFQTADGLIVNPWFLLH